MKYFNFLIPLFFLIIGLVTCYKYPKIEVKYKFIRIPVSCEPYSIYETTCKITGYNATVNQCDDTPNITASNKAVRLGMVAVSRDLEKRYNLNFGDYVFIKGLGLFEFQDRLNKRITNTIDILCWNRKTAYKLTDSGRIVHFIKVKK